MSVSWGGDDSTNRQHLEAMGLDPAILGQPVEAAPGLDIRCSVSSLGGYRCERQEGHSGSHALGGVTWVSQEQTGPQRAVQDRAEAIARVDVALRSMDLYGITFDDMTRIAAVAVDAFLEETR